MTGYYRKRLLLLVAMAAACAAALLVARWARVPYFFDYESSVWATPGAVARLAAVVLAFVAATAIATLVAGGLRLEAGLFCGTIALAALSTRAGPMRYVLTQAETLPSLYGGLFVELLVLTATTAALWATLVVSRKRKLFREAPAPSPDGGPSVSRPDRPFLALLIHVAVTGALALLLLASDDKKQAVTGLLAASFIGATIASWSTPARPGAWLWAGPAVVGLIGYAAAWWGHPVLGTAWSPGPLLRAAPLDYAGAGTAGAILGRWVGVTSEQAAIIASKVAPRA